MILDKINQISILPSNSSISAIEGVNVVSVDNGVATFNNFQAVKDISLSTANYTISSKAIDKVKVENILGSSFSQQELVINFRNCKPGEEQQGNKCQECAAGTYSVTWNSTECIKCDLNAD